MNRLFTSLIVPAALVAAVSLPASAAAPSLTPDQQLVAGLEEARSAARATLKGKPELGKLAEGMRRARRAAPHAVGALESPAMQAALRAVGAQAASATYRPDVRGARRLRRPAREGLPRLRGEPQLRVPPGVRELLGPLGDGGRRDHRGRHRCRRPPDGQRRRARWRRHLGESPDHAYRAWRSSPIRSATSRRVGASSSRA